MCLGSDERMEWVISGPLLRDMGCAAAEAQAGQFCVADTVIDYLDHSCVSEETPMGNHRLSSIAQSKSFPAVPSASASSLAPKYKYLFSPRLVSLSPREARNSTLSTLTSILSVITSRHHPIQPSRPSPQAKSEESSFRRRRTGVRPVDISNLTPQMKVILLRFIHESARPHVHIVDEDFLAEIRYVVTIFIELLNIQDDLDAGDIDRPQLAIVTILNVLGNFGGTLRQYVVDDKGCVSICSFGLSNFNYRDNELRAVLASIAIITELDECEISCRIGVSSGNAYCGYVGSDLRREYCVMGPSVNLAARLMCKAAEKQILVSDSVHEMLINHFQFDVLEGVKAKGYDAPIMVYSPIYLTENTCENNAQGSAYREKMVGRRAILAKMRALVRLSLNISPASTTTGRYNSMAFESAAPDTQTHDERRGSEGGSPRHTIITAPHGYGKTLLLHALKYSEKALKHSPIIACEASDRGDPFETLFRIMQVLLQGEAEDSEERVCPNLKGASRTTSKTYFQKLHSWVTLHMCSYAYSENRSKHSLKQRSLVLEEMDDLREARDSFSCPQTYRAIDIFSLLKRTEEDSDAHAPNQCRWSPDEMVLLRQFLHDALQMMIAMSRSGSLLLEDMHWMDDESYAVLSSVLSTSREGCFVGTARPPKSDALTNAINRCESFEDDGRIITARHFGSNVQIYRLPPFTMAEVKVAIVKVLGSATVAQYPSAISAATLERIHLLSGGVPSVVLDLVEELKTSLTTTLAPIVEKKRLTPWELDGIDLKGKIVLKVASVCGIKFSHELIAATLLDIGYPDISAALLPIFTVLKNNRLIRSTRSGLPYRVGEFTNEVRSRSSQIYCFTDKAVMEGIYESLLETQRIAMHASIASIVEGEYLTHPENFSREVVQFLAYHYLRAGANYFSPKVCYIEQAAQEALRTNQLAETSEYLLQLARLALNRCSVEEILHLYVGGVRHKVFSESLLTSRYLHRGVFTERVRSSCAHISPRQVAGYFADFSTIEFR
jgi:hypothetical protein